MKTTYKRMLGRAAALLLLLPALFLTNAGATDESNSSIPTFEEQTKIEEQVKDLVTIYPKVDLSDKILSNMNPIKIEASAEVSKEDVKISESGEGWKTLSSSESRTVEFKIGEPKEGGDSAISWTWSKPSSVISLKDEGESATITPTSVGESKVTVTATGSITMLVDVKVTTTTTTTPPTQEGEGDTSSQPPTTTTETKEDQINVVIKWEKSCDSIITVSGIVLDETSMEILEDERVPLPDYKLYGQASGKAVTWASSKGEYVRISNGTNVDGLQPTDEPVIVTATAGNYTAELKVTVKSNEAETITGLSVTEGGAISFYNAGVAGKIDAQCRSLTKFGLSYITSLNLSTDQGILFYNYVSEEEPGMGVAQSANYYYSAANGQYGIRDITFVPAADYDGEIATISYTGRSTDGKTFTGRIEIKITRADNTIYMAASTVSPAKMSGEDFNKMCQRVTGSALSRVSFSLPSESWGKLYYDYVGGDNYGEEIGFNQEYTVSQLDNVWFVPADGFSGTAILYYTYYTLSSGYYYGQVHIEVNQITARGPVYNISQNTTLTLDEDAFVDYCYKLTSGTELSHIRFRLPSSEQASLYYDYRSSTELGSRISSTTNYYVDRTPRISRITFVPTADFTGKLEIPFTGWNKDSTSFTGILEINVRMTGAGDITYQCRENYFVGLRRDDFNNLSKDITGSSLNYIMFNNLPTGDYGKLYLNRTATSTSGTSINTGTKYYYGSTPYIANVSFWAANDFIGTVEIGFTGVAKNGDKFNGLLKIEVVEYEPEKLSYSVDSGQLLTFSNEDFNSLSWDVNNSKLKYVMFELPDETKGTLYYNYRTSVKNNTKVKTTNKYNYNASLYLNQVSFLPVKDFHGIVEIPFTAYSQSEDTFEGVVEIYVKADENAKVITYATKYAPVNFAIKDFEAAHYGASALSSVQFASLPDKNAGYLYYEYFGPNDYSWKATTGTSFKVSGNPKLESLTFVPKAGYQGTVTLAYSATNADGSTYSGQLEIKVNPDRSSDYFTDLPTYTDQERAAADFLYDGSVVAGMSTGIYGPGEAIRRGDFALMLYKAFNLSSVTQGEAFQDVPNYAYYADAVHTLRALGIVSGTGNNCYEPNSTLTRQDAMVMVQKALYAVGWSTGMANDEMLDDYDDGNKVAVYARDAMAYLIQRELLPFKGTKLAPKENLTRIDMAVLLHRALTY